jgi:hypothetical protein
MAKRPQVGDEAPDFELVVIVDEEGVVRYRHEPLVGPSFQAVEDMRVAIDSIPAGAQSG